MIELNLYILSPTPSGEGDVTALMSGRAARAALTVPMLAATLGIMLLALNHAYGLGNLDASLDRARFSFLALGLLLCGADQVLRARRAQCLLSADRSVSLSDSYGAMVVGHGVGDTLPLIPGGLALRSLLTQRLSRVPAPFAAGAYMLEGLFDGLGPALLAAYLLVALAAPEWARLVLVLAVLQCMLLAVPIALRWVAPALHADWARHRYLGGLCSAAEKLLAGLRALSARGWRSTLWIVSLSLAITTVAALQLALFLRAFSLATSVRDMLLILVLTMVSGGIPIKFPGFGTLTAVLVLPAAGVHGPGLAAYVIVSRAVQSSFTPVVAACLLGWWAVTGNRALAVLADIRRFLVRPAGIPV